VFIYTTRLASNEKIKIQIFDILLASTVIVIISILIYTARKRDANLTVSMCKILHSIFSQSSKSLIIAVIIYLFFLIIVTTSIVSLNQSPLRPSSYIYD